MPQMIAIKLYSPLDVDRLDTALEQRLKPMSATVGPIITFGMSLSTQDEPTRRMTIAMIT